MQDGGVKTHLQELVDIKQGSHHTSIEARLGRTIEGRDCVLIRSETSGGFGDDMKILLLDEVLDCR